MTTHGRELLAIGDIASRTGLSVSAIRFYEEKGLVRSLRNRGGHRRFLRADIRRLSFIMVAQRLGFSIKEIRDLLSGLPEGRNPTLRDWQRISTRFRQTLDARIAGLEALRDNLDGCIGCGCLSLQKCALHNAGDHMASRGPGPHHLLPSTKDD
ncbi:MAG: redox-sensitive transcriptional activator SoxR [Pseudomonadota bacterium]